MNNILLLDSGTQALAIARDLYNAKHNVYLITSHRHNYGDDSNVLKKVILTNFDTSNPEYIKTIKKVVKQYNIHTMIPMSDKSAQFMSQHKNELLEIVDFDMPDYEIFLKGYNKSELMRLCLQNRYPHPQTFTGVNSFEDCMNLEIKFPLLIKPDITCGARGMRLVNNIGELEKYLPSIISQYGQCHLQQYIPKGGRQVEVQLYIDKEKRLKASSVISKFRWYPEKGGSSCCAQTVENDKIVGILYNLLKDLDWCGFADFDTIEDPTTGELLIMELNPRVPACVKASIVSGVPWGRIIVNEYLKQPPVEFDYLPGKILKHLGFEILWFIQSKNRFKSKPSLLKFFGKNLYFQDFDGFNFKPFLWGTFKNLKQLLNPEFRKSKKS